jgi:putative ABC transport system permease protein
VERYRAASIQSEIGPVQLAVADGRRPRSAEVYRLASGTPSQIWDQIEAGGLMISEPFAWRHGLRPGEDSLSLLTDDGPHTFPVVAVYYDYSSDQGMVLIGEKVYRQHWADRQVSSFGLYLEEDADAALVAAAAREELTGTGLQVRVNRELRREALQIFDRTFAITSALRLLAVIVAFIGVLSAVMALQLERMREVATLSALGLTRSGIWLLSSLESGLMGLSAGLLSLPTGLILAMVLIYVINLRSFGWTIRLEFDPWIFLQALAIGIGAALLAGVYPIWRLTAMPLAEALRRE